MKTLPLVSPWEEDGLQSSRSLFFFFLFFLLVRRLCIQHPASSQNNRIIVVVVVVFRRNALMTDREYPYEKFGVKQWAVDDKQDIVRLISLNR